MDMMLTPEEQLEIGLRTLQRFKQAMQERVGNSTPPAAPAPPGQPAPDRNINTIRQTTSRPFANTLPGLLRRAGRLGAASILLGSDSDGLPFVFDLTNPAPGAILIAGESGCGKTHLLRAALYAAVRLNPPEAARFYVLADDPAQFGDLADRLHCVAILPSDDPSALGLLDDLYGLAIDRQRGLADLEPAVIIAVDGLDRLAYRLSGEAFSRYYSLVRNGARTRIWTLASLTASAAARVDGRLQAAFRTLILGRTNSAREAALICSDPNAPIADLQAGWEFAVPLGEEWIRFRIWDDD
jgi:hypothetical protein